MLKGLDPLLSPDLLHTLRAMGHGDEIVIADANYPAEAMGLPVIRLDGLSATAVLEAVLSVMPLDTFVPEAAWRMEVVGDPDAEQPIFADFRDASGQARGERLSTRLARALRILCQSQNLFRRGGNRGAPTYGNIILKKGVVRPNA